MTFVYALIYLVIGFFVMRKTNGGVPAMLAGDGYPAAGIGMIIGMILLWPIVTIIALFVLVKR